MSEKAITLVPSADQTLASVDAVLQSLEHTERRVQARLREPPLSSTGAPGRQTCTTGGLQRPRLVVTSTDCAQSPALSVPGPTSAPRGLSPGAPKVLIIGSSGVGKTSIVRRAVEGAFLPNEPASIGLACCALRVHLAARYMDLQLWDAAGQERYLAITEQYFRGSHGALIVFDVTNEQTFRSVPSWLRRVQNALERSAGAQQSRSWADCVLLVGNKCDLSGRRQVPEAEARSFAESHGIRYHECAAATGEGVPAAFELIASTLAAREMPTTTPAPTLATLKVDPQRAAAAQTCPSCLLG